MWCRESRRTVSGRMRRGRVWGCTPAGSCRVWSCPGWIFLSERRHPPPQCWAWPRWRSTARGPAYLACPRTDPRYYIWVAWVAYCKTDLVVEKNIEAVHHVLAVRVVDEVVHLAQQEVQTVLPAWLGGCGRVVGVAVARLVRPEVEEDGGPDMSVLRPRREVVLAVRLRPLPPTPRVAVAPEVRLSLVVDGEIVRRSEHTRLERPRAPPLTWWSSSPGRTPCCSGSRSKCRGSCRVCQGPSRRPAWCRGRSCPASWRESWSRTGPACSRCDHEGTASADLLPHLYHRCGGKYRIYTSYTQLLMGTRWCRGPWQQINNVSPLTLYITWFDVETTVFPFRNFLADSKVCQMNKINKMLVTAVFIILPILHSSEGRINSLLVIRLSFKDMQLYTRLGQENKFVLFIKENNILLLWYSWIDKKKQEWTTNKIINYRKKILLITK